MRSSVAGWRVVRLPVNGSFAPGSFVYGSFVACSSVAGPPVMGSSVIGPFVVRRSGLRMSGFRLFALRLPGFGLSRVFIFGELFGGKFNLATVLHADGDAITNGIVANDLAAAFRGCDVFPYLWKLLFQVFVSGKFKRQAAHETAALAGYFSGVRSGQCRRTSWPDCEYRPGAFQSLNPGA